MLDYGVFKLGTYWVYQDSTSGRLDSVWVYKYEETYDTIDKSTNNPKICKVFLYTAFSSRYRTNLHYDYNSAFEHYQKLSPVVKSVIDSASGYVGEIAESFSPYIINQSIGLYTTYDISTLKSIENNYHLKTGEISNSVLKYYHTNDWTSYYTANYLNYSNKSYQYIAPHLGLIRKELPDSNKVWNLVRYHIVQ